MTRALVPGKWYYYRITNLKLISDIYGYGVYLLIQRIVDADEYFTNCWFKFSIQEGSSNKGWIMVSPHYDTKIWKQIEILKIRTEIMKLRTELVSLPKSKPSFLIDDDDEYQDQLEIGYEKDRIRGEIIILEERIKGLE
jgi:hypothetical protein